MLDFRLAQIFGIDKYDIDTGFPSGYLNNLCCLRDHYQAIMCSLFHVNEVERCQLTDVLECALGLIKKFETALMQETGSEPSQHVLTTANCLFDYLASSRYIALIKYNGTRVTASADYVNIYSYGVYLTNSCNCRPELQYLIECGIFEACVSGNTYVAIYPSGAKAIKDIQAGDLIYGLVNGEIVKSSVKTQLIHKGLYTLRKIELENHNDLVITDNHKILHKTLGWIEAKDIKIGDEIYYKVGDNVEYQKVIYIVKEHTVDDVVFNLKTTSENYFANGILIHNKCLSADTLIDTSNGLVKISSLKLGDMVYGYDSVNKTKTLTPIIKLYIKKTILESIPGRKLSENIKATNNHIVIIDNEYKKVETLDMYPVIDIHGDVYDLKTELNNYYVGDFLMGCD